MFINTSSYATPGNLAIYSERVNEGMLVREGRAYKHTETAIAVAQRCAMRTDTRYTEVRTRQGRVVWSTVTGTGEVA